MEYVTPHQCSEYRSNSNKEFMDKINKLDKAIEWLVSFSQDSKIQSALMSQKMQTMHDNLKWHMDDEMRFQETMTKAFNDLRDTYLDNSSKRLKISEWRIVMWIIATVVASFWYFMFDRLELTNTKLNTSIVEQVKIQVKMEDLKKEIDEHEKEDKKYYQLIK